LRRVVIVVGVAPEAFVLVEKFVQRDHALFGLTFFGSAARRRIAMRSMAPRVALDIEPRIGVLRDHQAAAREIDARVVAGNQLAEGLERDSHH
jgi:hypothetical protein